jgi:SAM-dependent methyltransferase
MHDLYAEMVRRYREHDIPWDQPLPPPEVIALSARLVPGRALDLGCGVGRTAIYLARQGWYCDGVDFVPQAIEMAQEGARANAVAEHTRFHVASVTRLGFLRDQYDLAVDIGCLHAQRGDALRAYARELSRLLRPGGEYLMFVRLLPRSDPCSTRGLTMRTIRTLFTPSFVFDHIEHGVTDTGGSPWPSAWFWMRRRLL